MVSAVLQHFPPVDLAFAYGSAVFKQQGRDLVCRYIRVQYYQLNLNRLIKLLLCCECKLHIKIKLLAFVNDDYSLWTYQSLYCKRMCNYNDIQVVMVSV